MKVIAIGAHPDDYEIGAGMRLIYHARIRKDDVIGLICSDGEKGGDRDLRIKEAEKAAEVIGLKNIVRLGFPDTRFPDIVSMKDRIEEVIYNEKPMLVYTHFPDDRHQDHRATYEAARIACRKIPSILTFKTPSTNISFQPHLFHYGLEDEFKKKYEILQNYKSQLRKDGGIDMKQVEHDLLFYGHFITNGCYSKPVYAEPFSANHFILNLEDSVWHE
ncbi:MAG: PIG-L family deacetylase [Candidatus Aenigmarchaeota archaeon]|nr:PIG-L family deacetylase [Candidatus Aenigmarchaeota archaeon]